MDVGSKKRRTKYFDGNMCCVYGMNGVRRVREKNKSDVKLNSTMHNVGSVRK